MGLETSEHIGRILVDPRDSDVVYVAAQGPVWSSGGDRGLYKTTDGGATWTRILHVDEDTGVTDVVIDPRDPDTLYAAAWQRRRHVWNYIGGGPGSGLHKSTDGGATWRKLTSGLPEGELGRIALAVSPQKPDVVYAIVEAEEDKGGFFRSTDRGESWEKRSDHTTSGNYYMELVTDPATFDRVYSLDTYLQVTDDGGKSFSVLGERSKHIDNHAIWIDPEDERHYLVGCDGGLYESFDRGSTWRFFENLPVTQFYRLALDDGWPVYQVCGGTQDNFSLCGPTRKIASQGPANEDWYVSQLGDGFWAAFDPVDPNLIYAEAQYGVLTRFDRRSGEYVDIQPVAAPGEPPLNFNWDAPLVVSPHATTRLYFAAQKVFRSDDRGDHWTAVSPDLTRGLDRDDLPVFGKIQRPETVNRGVSTSFYGNVVSLSESPLVEGLLYAGTDDGLVQVSENGGGDWRREERFPAVPERTYVQTLIASRHAADRIYAVFNRHKSGDFKPYVLRSDDRGRSWTSVAGDLPFPGAVYDLVEDPKSEKLLYVGTEYGVFATLDGGAKWVQLKGGMPTIQVRDLAIQERHDDLVAATFGRGFYVLDDLAPLRALSEAELEKEGLLFAPRDAWLWNPGSRIGLPGKGFLGETYWLGENPPFGAVFTWYVKDAWKSKKDLRREAESKADDEATKRTFPPVEALREESRQEGATLVLTIADAEGATVRKLEAEDAAGLHRTAWDLRYPPADPAVLVEPERSMWLPPKQGPFVAPGTYSATLARIADGAVTNLAGPVSFAVDALGNATLGAEDRAAVTAFQRQVAELQRAVQGAEIVVGQLDERLKLVRKAISTTPGLTTELDVEARALQLELEEISIALSGDRFLREQQRPAPPSISDRVLAIVFASWTASAEPTGTQRDGYRFASEAFETELAKLRSLAEERLPAIEAQLDAADAPYTPGRLPVWPPAR